MKSSLKTIAAALALVVVSLTSSQAQILGSLYSTGTTTPATAQDFIDAGVTGITSSNTVTGFDISGTAPYSSGGLTLTPGSNGGSYGTVGAGPIYQSGIYTGDGNPLTLTLTGLSGQLKANQSYQLYVFGAAIFHTNPDPRYGQSFTLSYAFNTPSQTGSVNLVGNGDGEFTLTTGLVVPNSLTLFVEPSGTNPAVYPAITAFALVGQTVPEPSTWALTLGGLALLFILRVRSSRV